MAANRWSERPSIGTGRISSADSGAVFSNMWLEVAGSKAAAGSGPGAAPLLAMVCRPRSMHGRSAAVWYSVCVERTRISAVETKTCLRDRIQATFLW